MDHISSKISSAINVSKAYASMNRHRIAIMYCKESIIDCLSSIKNSTEKSKTSYDDLIRLLEKSYYYYGINLKQIGQLNEAYKYFGIALDLCNIHSNCPEHKAELMHMMSDMKSNVRVFASSQHSSKSICFINLAMASPSQKKVVRVYSRKLPIVSSPQSMSTSNLKNTLNSESTSKQRTSIQSCVTLCPKSVFKFKSTQMIVEYMQNKRKLSMPSKHQLRLTIKAKSIVSDGY